MAFQFSISARNAALDAIETTVGVAPILTVRTGAAPADCAAAASGTVLATLTLPSDWMSAATVGSKPLLGTWQDTAADATGTAGHFRITQGATCHVQGSITLTGAGGDMTLDNTSIAVGQQVTVSAFTLTAGGA
jgi:hypothetical protein